MILKINECYLKYLVNSVYTIPSKEKDEIVC